MPRACKFGSDGDLRRNGGSKVEDRGHDSFSLKGWKFTSVHTKMIDSSELGALETEVCGDFSDHLHIPPMIFGNDVMTVEKEGASESDKDPLKLSINARDALKCWSAQHSPARMQQVPLDIVLVPYAKTWIEKSLPSSSGDGKSADDSGDGLCIDDAALQRKWDWTFSSDYCGTLQDTEKLSFHELNHTEVGSVFDEALNESKNIYKSTSSGINFDMLKERDAPILFFDEIVLYQDDLEDCGEVVFEAKLRVMPNCFFILSRNFVRVDSVVVKIRESRFFHAFGEDKVHLEVTWKECSIGSGMEGYPHVDINPNALRDVNKLSQMVPPTKQSFYSMLV